VAGWLTAAFVLACGGASVPPTVAFDPALLREAAAPPPPPPPPRDDGRLPTTAIPERYRVALRIDPSKPRFSGVTSIQVSLPEATFYVVLNARDMNVSRAVARAAPGGDGIAAIPSLRLSNGGVVPEELVLTFARQLPAGPALIEIEYDAPFAPDLAGLYRVEENGRHYAFTQFETTDARRAMPCFDEPAFKTAYDVEITSPRGTMALTNSPETSSVDTPDGMVVHHFETTGPLPSYLVAFAVGDFDVLEGQKEPFPIRVVTTRGRAQLAGLALDAATALVAKLGDYFDLRYPFPKLDLVAVPDFAAGAMENPGLVTFRDALLLLDPKRATTALRRKQAAVIAHEFAHQWFGDLVTMRWWDDIWLNEGFATWAEAKVVDAWKPDYGATLEQLSWVQHVMDTDALQNARAVREPVRSTGEAKESFDGITYDKGAAVLRMLESFLGPDTFRRGVQRYLHENAWKTARADELFQALDFVSTQKVGPLAGEFLDHPGVPAVAARYTCGAGGSKVELRQSEWRPLGGNDGPTRSWTVPVCVETDAQKTKSCFTLGPEPVARDLGPGCPTWLYPNADLGGYYRFVLDRPKLLALARAARGLGAADRLGLVSNAWASVRQGTLESGALLDVLSAFDGDMNRLVIDEIVDVLRGVEHILVEDVSRPAFRKFVAARLAGRKRLLGWEPPTAARTGAAAKQEEDRSLERRQVLWAMGELAGDKATLDEAEKYAAAWLKDPTAVSADVASVAVPLASIRAGVDRLEELRAAAKRAQTPEERATALGAIGCFEDPTVLRRALDLLLTDEFKLSELHYVWGAAAGRRSTRAVLYAWEKENWEKLRVRLPGDFGDTMLIGVAGAACTASERDDARAFFTAATQGMQGVKRPLDEALESAGLCVALREHSMDAVSKYLLRR
jgi:aminopeptidase N